MGGGGAWGAITPLHWLLIVHPSLRYCPIGPPDEGLAPQNKESVAPLVKRSPVDKSTILTKHFCVKIKWGKKANFDENLFSVFFHGKWEFCFRQPISVILRDLRGVSIIADFR